MGRFFNRTVRAWSLNPGFTLIELTVVAAIIGILSVVIIVGQGSFSRSILLLNTTQDIALSLRNTQLMGVGSRTVGSVSNAGHGLYFSGTTSYLSFADTYPGVSPTGTSCHPPRSQGPTAAPDAVPGDCVYNGSAFDYDVQTYTLNNGMQVSNFCAYAGSTWYCKSGTATTIQHLSIVFARPFTNAYIGAGASIGSGSDNVGGVKYSKACVTITSPQGAPRYIHVTSVGQITVSGTVACPISP